MTSASALFLFFFFLSACSLFHQDHPNQAPVIQGSTADTLKVRREGRISLRVQASDEDDDPLFYQWSALGAGDFSDTTCVRTAGPAQLCSNITWKAPETISSGSDSELFPIAVTIRDRRCEIVQVEEARRQCETEAGEIVETFLVEVVQTPPTLEIGPDTTVVFSGQPIELDAFGMDGENDVLTYNWEQIDGEPIGDLEVRRIDDNHSRMSFVPPSLGGYRFRVEVSDGIDADAGEIQVHVIADSDPPEEG